MVHWRTWPNGLRLQQHRRMAPVTCWSPRSHSQEFLMDSPRWAAGRTKSVVSCKATVTQPNSEGQQGCTVLGVDDSQCSQQDNAHLFALMVVIARKSYQEIIWTIAKWEYCKGTGMHTNVSFCYTVLWMQITLAKINDWLWKTVSMKKRKAMVPSGCSSRHPCSHCPGSVPPSPWPQQEDYKLGSSPTSDPVRCR